jgi:hypothetical protein
VIAAAVSMRHLMVMCLGTLAFAAGGPVRSADPAWEGRWWSASAEPRLLPADGKPLPFTAVGRERYSKTQVELKSGKVVDAAVYLCSFQGMPRALTSAYPFQTVVTPGQVTFLHEENRAFRVVRLAAEHADPTTWDPAYMGDAIGNWSGDSLVIDSTNFKSDSMYLDATGLPASARLHLREQLSLKNGGSQLEDLVTVEDPEIFTRPWTARRVYARRDDIELATDWVCGEKHRDLSAARRPATTAPATSPVSAARMEMNGFWNNAVRPRGSLSIARAAAGDTEEAPEMAAMLRYQQPWGAAELAKAKAAMAAGQYVPTPEMQCYPAQVPGTGRIAPGGYGLQLLVSPRYVVVLAEQNAVMRVIRLDQKHPDNLVPGWQGDSVGHWESDTLVVDTAGFNGRNYLDRGVPFTAKMHIVERMRMVNGELVNEATFDDPGAFTATFTITKAYRRGKPFQEYVCQENNHEGGVPTITGRPTEMDLPQAGPP